MRKKLIIAAVIILVLLLSFFLFLQYRQYRSYQIPIHAQAQTILKLHTDGIIKELLFNYGTQYRKKVEPDTDKPDSASKRTGIYFPANIFIYNVHSKLSDTYFTCLPIYKEADFKTYIQSNFGLTIIDSAGKFYGVSADEKIKLIGNQEYVVLSYSKNLEDVSCVLLEILEQKNILPQESVLLKKLKKQSSILGLVGNGFRATMDIRDNQLNIVGELDIINRLLIPNTKYRQSIDENMMAGISLNAIPPAKTLKPVYEINGYQLETDTLLKYYRGFAAVQFGPNRMFTDTIISYVYDDNFEMQAVSSLQEVPVPQIQLQLAADKALYSYLQRIEFVNEAGRFNKTVFPLYPVQVYTEAGYLYFTTTQATFSAQKPDSTEDILRVRMNLKNMDSTGIYAFIKPYTEGMQTIVLSAKHARASTIRLVGKLLLDDKAIDWLLKTIKNLD